MPVFSKPGIWGHQLYSHPSESKSFALGVRLGRRELESHPKSKSLASVREDLQVTIEVGNVHELAPGRVEIPASSRHRGLRRAEFSAVSRRRLSQPACRVNTGERLDLSFLAAYEHHRDLQLQRAFHRAHGVFHGRLLRRLLVKAQAVEQ